MKRIALLLILVALPAWAQTLTCPAGATVTLTCAGAAQPVPTPAPVQPPAPPNLPPAPPAPLPAGWALNTSPVTYENVIGPNTQLPFDINTQLTYKFRAGPNQINVHPITFSSAWYTGQRAALSTAITVSNSNSRDYWFSLVPNGPPPSPYCRAMNQGLAGVFVIEFGQVMGACVLRKDLRYYLNVKASAPGMTVDYLLNATPL